jgi:hypothetical protein
VSRLTLTVRGKDVAGSRHGGPVDVGEPVDGVSARPVDCDFATCFDLPDGVQTTARAAKSLFEGPPPALGGFAGRGGAGPRVAFFSRFKKKKKPSGDQFQTLNIFSRKQRQFDGDEYIRGGSRASKETPGCSA